MKVSWLEREGERRKKEREKEGEIGEGRKREGRERREEEGRRGQERGFFLLLQNVIFRILESAVKALSGGVYVK